MERPNDKNMLVTGEETELQRGGNKKCNEKRRTTMVVMPHTGGKSGGGSRQCTPPNAAEKRKAGSEAEPAGTLEIREDRDA